MQRVLLTGWLVLGLALTPGSVSAAPIAGESVKAPAEPKQAGSHAEDSHGAHGGQRGLLDLAVDLGIWTFVVFLLLLLVLRKLAWKPMLEGLKNREHNIANALQEAEKAHQETLELQAKLQAKMDAASQQIAGMMEEARRDAQHTADEMRAEARKDIQTERERLHREMQVARDQALQELWTQTAQLATLISSKALGRHMTESDHTRLVDESLQEFYKAGTEQYRQVASVQKS